jgi:ABC-2 type transport system permease protein
VCFLFTMSGLDLVLNFFQGWAPALIVDTVASLSFLVRFDAVMRGVIDLRDVLFFVSLIAFFLFTNVIVVEVKKSA